MTQSDSEISCSHSTKVKVRSGGSLVKVKPFITYDSKYLLVASGCDIKVFSITSGQSILIFKGHEHPVVSIQPNRRNKLQVLSCSEDGVVIKWDYSDGKPLKKFNVSTEGKLSAFFCPSSEGPWFVITKTDNLEHYCVHSVVPRAIGLCHSTLLLSPVHNQENAVAFGPDGCFVAGIYESSLQLIDIKYKSRRTHKTGERNLTCITCHPFEHIVATGDIHGRIIVWSRILEDAYPVKTIYHWHSLHLLDLVFSPEGTHIYSGGYEAALVRWNLNQETKKVVPRLGLPICRVTVSPDNHYIVASHTDNALQILNSQNVVVQVIQGLTLGHCQSNPRNEIVPTGMLYDVRTEALVLNGRPGHLQFYNIREDKQLFQLDIVGRNYISQERDSVIYNVDVEKAAIHSSGLWLATVECRDDGETSMELRMKFWQYDITLQKFSLNTNILLPHNKKVNCLKFRPNVLVEDSDENPLPLAVTTSDDKRFKIWTLSADDKQKFSWSCELMGYYKDLPAGDACFSEDSSLLAVAFDFIITLWTPETNLLKATFSNPNDSSSVKQVLFGNGKCSHLLVSRSEEIVTVWNVLTLNALWSVKCASSCLASDSFSNIMASFTKDGKIVIFQPDYPKPLAVVKNASSTPIISAIFIPRLNKPSQTQKKSHCWQCNSHLYFLNEDQLLLTLYDENEEENHEVEDSEMVMLKGMQPITPFGMLQAEHVISDVKIIKPEMHIFHDIAKDETEFPCPTHVNPISLAESVISSLLQPYLKQTSEPAQNHDAVEPEASAEAKSELPEVDAQSNLLEPMDTSESVLVHINDFSFLLDYVT